MLEMSRVVLLSAMALLAVTGAVRAADEPTDKSSDADSSSAEEKGAKMKIRTFTMIKPGSVEKAEEIKARIIGAGFKIAKEKKLKLTLKQAEEFYEVHKDRPFYSDLCKMMSSGEVIVMIIEKDENAVNEYRELMGATDPAKADKGTLRGEFGTDVQNNAVHGSDSPENARREIGFFFPDEVE
jgi:nucleoside-diphosphate kinase